MGETYVGENKVLFIATSFLFDSNYLQSELLLVMHAAKNGNSLQLTAPVTLQLVVQCKSTIIKYCMAKNVLLVFSPFLSSVYKKLTYLIHIASKKNSGAVQKQ